MSETREIVSVITCDLEGRIETFNPNAEKLFGYSADEVIGKKRVSLFSPGMVVLGHVANWLDKAKENKDGYSTETTFVRKSGEQFAASFKITATVIKGKHVGYCGRTRELKDVSPEDTMPKTSLLTKFISIVAITSLPFLSATWIPIIAAVIWGLNASLFQMDWALFTTVGRFLMIASKQVRAGSSPPLTM